MAYPSVRAIRRQVGTGDTGTRDTLKAMGERVALHCADPIVVETAHRIIQGIPPRAELEQALRIRDWMRAHYKFVKDPRGVELLRDPDYQLRQFRANGVVQGDCDDAAILSAALWRAIGGRGEFVAVALNDATAPFQHVFSILTVRRGEHRVNMDVTKPRGLRVRYSRAMRWGF